MAESSPERHIWLESCFNFRDMGGYTTESGATLQWRRLFRSGQPGLMTAQDAAVVRDTLGVRTVIDLREPGAAQDAEQGLLTQPPVHHHSVPMIDSLDEWFSKVKKPSSLEEDYLTILRHPTAAKKIAEAVTHIAEGLPHSVVFHCTMGKDRTGILAMVLLGSLGVPDEQIIEDFVLTELDLGRAMQWLRQDAARARRIKSLPEWTFEASPDTMKAVLESLKREFGSIRGYAAAQGVSESVFQKLESSLLV